MYYCLLRTTEIWVFLHICLFNVGLVMQVVLRFYVLLNVHVVL